MILFLWFVFSWTGRKDLFESIRKRLLFHWWRYVAHVSTCDSSAHCFCLLSLYSTSLHERFERRHHETSCCLPCSLWCYPTLAPPPVSLRYLHTNRGCPFTRVEFLEPVFTTGGSSDAELKCKTENLRAVYNCVYHLYIHILLFIIWNIIVKYNLLKKYNVSIFTHVDELNFRLLNFTPGPESVLIKWESDVWSSCSVPAAFF